MSVGNVPAKVDLNSGDLVLVLGENRDMGDDEGSRNGVGKSTIANAISYVLQDKALTNIKKDNLINNVNKKGMVVSLKFIDTDTGINYKIIRGRKPNILRFFVNETEVIETDMALGENRDTQDEISKVIGMSHDMLKHILALNTYTEPFLTMKVADQRVIIEQLLGITRLSEKAESLKEQIKLTKDDIGKESARIDAINAANTRILSSIDTLKRNQIKWKSDTDAAIDNMTANLDKLCSLDIEAEIGKHIQNDAIRASTSRKQELISQISRYERDIANIIRDIEKNEADFVKFLEQKCPTCNQDICSDNHVGLQEEMIQKIDHLEKKLVEYDNIAETMRQELNGIPDSHVQSTHYSTLAEAYVHQTNVNNLIERLDERYNATDPYEQQIQELSNTALQEISWAEVNRLNHNLKHQELLLKLLTHRDSFVRKRIIDQNLSHLNNRLSYYLDKMGLPHSVTFQNDLTVEITQMGRDLDFDNLSRGERNRLILSLSWTFRDVYESMYKPVNFMLVDELIDNGLDPSGVESALKVLKTLNVERNKTILLISHRDELHGRVSSVLKVIKERGFTTFLS